MTGAEAASGIEMTVPVSPGIIASAEVCRLESTGASMLLLVADSSTDISADLFSLLSQAVKTAVSISPDAINRFFIEII